MVAVPVEYRKGRPRFLDLNGAIGDDSDDENSTGTMEPWPTDRIQVGLQAILLERAGYTVPKAVLYLHQRRLGCQLSDLPLEGSSRAVSLALDVLATDERMGRVRSAGRHLNCISRPTRRPASARLGRIVCRRDVLASEKRELSVRKTKRGKGTKWMVVADGSGLPLACRTASASPAEITLVEDLAAQAEILGEPVPLVADRAYDRDRLPRSRELPKAYIEKLDQLRREGNEAEDVHQEAAGAQADQQLANGPIPHHVETKKSQTKRLNTRGMTPTVLVGKQ